jgi:hypothetical protein
MYIPQNNIMDTLKWSSDFVTGNLEKPSAYITVNKNRLKIYDSKKVFLKNKQTFEIELFNPLTQPVLAKIQVNGKPIGSDVVVRPGERLYLERFTDINAKFLFDVYDVSDSAETQRIRENNGSVSVSFHGEAPKVYFRRPIYNNYPNTLTYTNSSNLTSPFLRAYNLGDNINTNNVYFSSTDNIGSENNNTVETGRVEMGDASSQEFTNYYGNFHSYPTHVVNYQILPESQKQTVAEDIRNYCTSCGTRQRKTNWKYCPSCGEKYNS